MVGTPELTVQITGYNSINTSKIIIIFIEPIETTTSKVGVWWKNHPTFPLQTYKRWDFRNLGSYINDNQKTHPVVSKEGRSILEHLFILICINLTQKSYSRNNENLSILTIRTLFFTFHRGGCVMSSVNCIRKLGAD